MTQTTNAKNCTIFSSGEGIGLSLLAADEDAGLEEPLEPITKDVPTRMKLALQHAMDKKHALAEAELREIIAIDGQYATAHHNLGVALVEQGKRAEAIPHFRKALELFPDYFDAHRNLGATLISLDRKNEAVDCFREAVRLQPNSPELFNDVGFLLTDVDRPAEGAVYLRQAIRMKPDFAVAYNNLGIAMVKQARFAEAEAAYEQALRLDPKLIDSHMGLGSVMGHQGRPAEAAAYFDVAIWLKPESTSARFNRSLALLHLGDFERGWVEYEWRWKRQGTAARPFKQPQWDGSPLNGKRIFLYMEQGMGDAIQFVRYAPIVKAMGATVILECRTPLVRLLGGFQGVDQLVPEGASPPAFDVHAPIMSLPLLLRTRLDNIPDPTSYIRAEPALVEGWRKNFADEKGLKIGIVWQGNPSHKWDRYRSVPLTQFADIARIPGVHLYSLQRGKGIEQLNNPHRSFKVTRLLDPTESDRDAWAGTAAIMKNMDLVIGVDTASIHLAGALGVPVWVAISKGCDWRWLMDRDDSPWYPTMRLFRQPEFGQWQHLFDRMATEVGVLAAAKAERQ